LEGEWLVVDRQMISTDPQASFWLDVDQFRRLVRAWETHGHPQDQACAECLEALAEAVALYQGDFLQGFGLRDSIAYDDWQFFQAERLRQELASALERLVYGHFAHGNQDAALGYARQWLALDPLHEPAHRQLMQLYSQTGQRSAALRQYQECLRTLEEELGLAPARETIDLYEQIRTRSFADLRLASIVDRSEGEDLPIRVAPLPHKRLGHDHPGVGRLFFCRFKGRSVPVNFKDIDGPVHGFFNFNHVKGFVNIIKGASFNRCNRSLHILEGRNHDDF